jgi:hypothetical protein
LHRKQKETNPPQIQLLTSAFSQTSTPTQSSEIQEQKYLNESDISKLESKKNHQNLKKFSADHKDALKKEKVLQETCDQNETMQKKSNSRRTLVIKRKNEVEESFQFEFPKKTIRFKLINPNTITQTI